MYDVAPADATFTWVAQCAAPMPPLDSRQVAEGFGRSDLRMAVFDCQQSWLYPAGVGGWTVLPGEDISDDWASERLAGTSLSFRQGEFWSHPALTIYEQHGELEATVPPRSGATVAPSDWPLGQAVADGTAVTAPVRMAGPLIYLGYELQSQTDGVELRTYWRVDGEPFDRAHGKSFGRAHGKPDRPLSLMAHLLAADGTLIATGDGLGVPIEVWEPGDVIVQRHHLALAEDGPTGPYWLQTGVYWLDTLERWPVVVDGQVLGDRFLLTTVSD